MNIKLSAFLMVAGFAICFISAAQAQTPTPTAGQSLALMPDQIKFLKKEQIAALTPDQVKTLSVEQIQALSSDQLKALKRDQLAQLTPSQINGLLTDQVKAIAPEQIKLLRPDQIQVFKADQMKVLTIQQIQALTPEQIQALTPGTTTTPTISPDKVPLAQAHTIFASNFSEYNQDASYPTGPQGVLFVTPDELDNSVTSNNWARLRYGAATVTSQPIKGFILLEAPNRLEQVYVYVANSDNQIDLTKQPYKTALTPKMKQDHYGDLYPHLSNARTILGTIAGSVYPLLGVSVNTLGDMQATKGSPTTFLVGAGTDLGPYAGVNLGLAAYSQSSRITSGLSLGFSLDLALLNKIFK